MLRPIYAILCGCAAAAALKPNVRRRAWIGSASAAAVAVAAPNYAVASFFNPAPPESITLSDAEVDALLGRYGVEDVALTYAPNGAPLKLKLNEVDEMRRVGKIAETGGVGDLADLLGGGGGEKKARGLELRTFAPRYWFPKAADEDWYSPFANRKLNLEFKDSGSKRRAACAAVSDALQRRVAAKVAAVADAAPPPGYEAPEPEDPTLCGRAPYRFKCADVEAPGSYQKLVQAEQMKEYRAKAAKKAAAKAAEEKPAKAAFPRTGRELLGSLAGAPPGAPPAGGPPAPPGD